MTNVLQVFATKANANPFLPSSNLQSTHSTSNNARNALQKPIVVQRLVSEVAVVTQLSQSPPKRKILKLRVGLALLLQTDAVHTSSATMTASATPSVQRPALSPQKNKKKRLKAGFVPLLLAVLAENAEAMVDAM